MPAVSAESLIRLFSTVTIDRVLRCLTGSVAVSAYELESLPLPDAGVLDRWAQLDGEDLSRAISSAYRPGMR
jgi:adenine-specific DNA-methyltransferase